MTAATIRQILQQYIDEGDEKLLLNLMSALAGECNEDDDFEDEFSEEEIKLFEERRNKRLSGESETYSWQEAWSDAMAAAVPFNHIFKLPVKASNQ